MDEYDNCYDPSTEEFFSYDYYTLVYDTEREHSYSYYFEAATQAFYDGYITIDKSSVDAQDNSYRYSGYEPNNYVCLGNILRTATTEKLSSGDVIALQKGQCDSVKNLYRIIGIFPNEKGEYQAKLIKSEYITQEELKKDSNPDDVDDIYKPRQEVNEIYYDTAKIKSKKYIHNFYWNAPSDDSYYDMKDNIWAQDNQKSLLNYLLNSSYLNTTLADWQDKIAEATWYIEGIDNGNDLPKVIYEKEMRSTPWGNYPVPQATSKAKVGLMYISDFAFANLKDYWKREVDSLYINPEYNWLFNGVVEWTITRDNRDEYNDVWAVEYYGGFNIPGEANGGMSQGVRPVFYLNPEVIYVSGDGSYNNPYTVF